MDIPNPHNPQAPHSVTYPQISGSLVPGGRAASHPPHDAQHMNITDNSSDTTEDADDEEITDAESEDDSEGEVEGSLPPIKNPSTDIRGDFANALDGESTFKGSFHFQKDYPDAPNPILRLDNVGYIGLPLDEPTAQRIIPRCERAHKVTTDSMFGGPWAMDASKVYIHNTRWNAFITRTVEEVCVGLGVDAAVSQPRCELHKLLLWEKGSHFLPHDDAKSVVGMFATVIVLLPSPFTGGEILVSHGSDIVPINFASTSLMSTSLLSWYTNATIETNQIQSGYRLALSYHLIHTTKTLMPSIPPVNDNIIRLRQVLQYWMQNLSEAPEKMVYLLDHNSNAPVRGNALVGQDAHRVALLQELGTEYGFHLGLATAEVEQSGYITIDGMGDGWGRGRRGYDSSDDDDDPDPEGLDFDKDDEIQLKLSVKNLVDLKGKMLVKTLELQRNPNEEEDEDGYGTWNGEPSNYVECVPADLREVLVDDEPDRQEYDRSDRDSGKLTRWYRRIVVVIWPIAHEDTKILRLSYPQSVLKSIEASTSKKPAEREHRLVEEVIGMARRDRALEISVLRTMSRAATQWGRLDLWLRAFDACHGDENAQKMGSAAFVTAIEAFHSGIHAIGPSIERTLRNEPSNTTRLQLLHALRPVLEGEKLLSFQQWVWTQRKVLLASMQSLDSKDIIPILDAARLIGELPVIEGVVSQIKPTASTANLLAVAMEIAKETPALLFRSPEGIDMQRRLIRDLLSVVINKTNYFAPPSPAPSSYSYYQPQPKFSPDVAIRLLQVCLQTDNIDLTAAIAEKVVSTVDLSTEAIQSHTEFLLVPLVLRLGELARVQGVGVGTISGFRIIYDRAVPLMLEMSTKRPLSEEDVAVIFEAADMGGGLEFIANSVVPRVKSLCANLTSLMHFIRKLNDHPARLIPPSSGLPSVSTMVEGLVRTLVDRPQQRGVASEVTAVELVGFAWEMGLPEICDDILSRIFLEEPRPLAANRVSSVLMPSIKPLAAFLARHGIAPTTEPFSLYFKKVVNGCVDLVLGPKPPDMTAAIASARRITCRCASCTQLVAFITTSSAPTLTLPRIGLQGINHVEFELRRACGSAVAMCKTSRSTSKLSLEVQKTDAVLRHCRWEPQSLATIQLIKAISTHEPVLLDILGVEGYRNMLQVLGVNGINEVLPAAHPSVVAQGPAAEPSSAGGTGAIATPSSDHTVSTSAAPRTHMDVEDPVALQSQQPPSVLPSVEARSPPRKKRKTGDIQVIDLTSP